MIERMNVLAIHIILIKNEFTHISIARALANFQSSFPSSPPTPSFYYTHKNKL